MKINLFRERFLSPTNISDSPAESLNVSDKKQRSTRYSDGGSVSIGAKILGTVVGFGGKGGEVVELLTSPMFTILVLSSFFDRFSDLSPSLSLWQ